MEDRYLFKAKSLENDKWEIGHFVEDQGWAYITKLLENGRFDVIIVNSNTVCQCTGLKDKNNNLIWENDIVEIGEHEDTVNGLYKVIYCENAHCYALKRSVDFHYNFFTFSDLNGFETSSKVIGNIFDNAELLESEG